MRIFINERKNKVAAAFDLKILSFTTTKQVGYFSQKCHISGIFLLPPVNFRPTHAIIWNLPDLKTYLDHTFTNEAQ